MNESDISDTYVPDHVKLHSNNYYKSDVDACPTDESAGDVGKQYFRVFGCAPEDDPEEKAERRIKALNCAIRRYDSWNRYNYFMEKTYKRVLFGMGMHLIMRWLMTEKNFTAMHEKSTTSTHNNAHHISYEKGLSFCLNNVVSVYKESDTKYEKSDSNARKLTDMIDDTENAFFKTFKKHVEMRGGVDGSMNSKIKRIKQALFETCRNKQRDAYWYLEHRVKEYTTDWESNFHGFVNRFKNMYETSAFFGTHAEFVDKYKNEYGRDGMLETMTDLTKRMESQITHEYPIRLALKYWTSCTDDGFRCGVKFHKEKTIRCGPMYFNFDILIDDVMLEPFYTLVGHLAKRGQLVLKQWMREQFFKPVLDPWKSWTNNSIANQNTTWVSGTEQWQTVPTESETDGKTDSETYTDTDSETYTETDSETYTKATPQPRPEDVKLWRYFYRENKHLTFFGKKRRL
jgi:hypothetical protein